MMHKEFTQYFQPPLDTRSMCVRARLVYRQAVGTVHIDNDGSCISTSSGCKGKISISDWLMTYK